MNKSSDTHVSVAVLLAMTMALGPLALDMYLPAFPAMAASLSETVHSISLSISCYVFVLALGQLVGGPLSDRFGRPLVMLAGLGMFGIASALISRVTTIEQLLVMRSIQAFGGGWAVVCVPAIVRDRLSGTEAARFFSLIGLLMVLAPAVAPNLGSLILAFFGWPAIFLFISMYALALFILLKVVVFVGGHDQPAPSEQLSVWDRYRSVFSTRPALRFLFLQALSFSAMLLFISHSAFIYQEHFGVSPTVFSLLFGVNVVAMMAISLINRSLLRHIKPEAILRWSVSLQGVGILLLLCVMIFKPKLWLFVPTMMITIGAMGAITPNTQACYMEYFSRQGGTASALLGAAQFSTAGLISALSALLSKTVVDIILAQVACLVLCLFLIWTFNGNRVAGQPDTPVKIH